MRHKSIRSAPLIIAVAALLFSSSCAGSDDVVKKQQEYPVQHDERIEGEYIVTLHEAAQEDFLYETFSQNEIYDVEEITDRIFLVRLKIDPEPHDIQAYLKNDNIKAIQPNFKYEIDKGRRRQ